MKMNKFVTSFNDKDFNDALGTITNSVNVYGNYQDFCLDFDLKHSELLKKERVRYLTEIIKANASQSISCNHNEVLTYNVAYKNNLFEFVLGPTFLIVKKLQKRNDNTYHLENVLESLYTTL